jgi:hypothetical protein
MLGLRFVRWEILKGWEPKSKGFNVEVELNHQVERSDYGMIEVSIDYRIGLVEKEMKIWGGFKILRGILAESLAWLWITLCYFWIIVFSRTLKHL